MSQEQEIGKSLSSLLQEALSASFNYQADSIHTIIPCIVLAVRDNLNGMMVDIQPTINQKLEDGTTAERPQILGVPVQFPCSKTAAFTFPINVGDTGIALFSMRNLDAWKNGTGRPTAPMNNAKFDKGDAIFIPGIQPPSVSINNPAKRTWPHDTKDAVLVNNIGTGNEVEIRLKANGDCIINTNQNVEVNCENLTANVNTRAEVYAPDILIDASNSIELSTNTLQVTAPGGTTWIGNITMTGNLIQTGTYSLTGAATFNGIAFDTHKHTGVQAGPSNTGGPTN